MLLFTVVLFAIQVVNISAAGAWGYVAPIGPSNWSSLGYPLCASTRQSPIDIETASAVYNSALTTLDISSYSEASTDETITITNSGHSVSIGITYPTATRKYTIKNGGFSATYVLDSVHFHWGPNNEHGSEHEINGHAYPLEAHFVHYRQDLESVTNGKTESTGLAVLGFFFSVSTTNNDNFDFLLDLLANVSYKGQSVTLPTKFTPSTLIPSDHSIFYRYLGSLTTPSCEEAVIWTVFKTVQTIGSEQLTKFRELFETTASENETIHLEENFRPVQALNGRTITTSDITNTGITVVTSSFIFLLGCIMVSISL